MVSFSNKAKTSLDNLLNRAVEEGRVPGVTVAVGTADKVLYSGAAGPNAYQVPSSKPRDKDSVYWICSQTKLVVSIAILQLIEKGLLNYETLVEEIIPELANPVVLDDHTVEKSGYKPAQTKITVKHLLNHSSGIFYTAFGRDKPGALPPGYTSAAYEGEHTVEKFFKILKNGFPGVPLAFEPGTNWTYGWNTEMATFIVERLTKKSIEEYCQEKIFGPLGMKTSFYLTPAMKQNLVPITFRRHEDGVLEKWDNQLKVIEQDPEKMKVLLGGIGLYSTLEDYLILLQHLLGIEAGSAKNPILSVGSVSDLFKPTLPANAAPSIPFPDSQWSVGLSLANNDWPGRRKKGSGFWWGWAGTYYFMDPSTGIAVVFGTLVAPPPDAETLTLWEEVEKAIYAGLEA